MKRKIAVWVGVAVAVLVVLGFIGRSQMLKMRERFEGRHPELDVMKERPSDVALKYESFTATNPEGTRIAGWWLPAQTPAGSIVMVHGFGQNKSMMLGRAAVLVGAGFNVALIDLRARGESGGDRARSCCSSAKRIVRFPTHKPGRSWPGIFTPQAVSTYS